MRQQRQRAVADAVTGTGHAQVAAGGAELGVAEQLLMLFRSTPASSRCVAKQCRSVWMPPTLAMPAALRAA